MHPDTEVATDATGLNAYGLEWVYSFATDGLYLPLLIMWNIPGKSLTPISVIRRTRPYGLRSCWWYKMEKVYAIYRQ